MTSQNMKTSQPMSDNSHKKKLLPEYFPPIKMADRDAIDHLKCACALIICGSCHFTKELKYKSYFVISQNRIFDITKS